MNRKADDVDASNKTLITVAHADDNLLFMSPDEYSLVKAGGAVQVVYLTTGDNGRGSNYWHLREEGARAGAADMAGVPNRWRQGAVTVNGYSLALDTLVADPRLTIIYMRLPDGNVNGSGYRESSYESLRKLWTGEISTIASASRATYTKTQLADTLAGVIRLYKPDTLYTQNFLGNFKNGDHTDHVATGLLTIQAARTGSTKPCPILGYQGYPVHALAANVSGGLLHEKEAAFLAYSKYDPYGCTPLAECFAPGLFAATYGSWLKRQYVVARIPAGSTTPQPVNLT